jgi:tricorn protease interacting factor F2/3
METIQPTHYRIRIEPDLKQFQFKGQVTITLQTPSDANQVVLNLLDLAVWQCRAKIGESNLTCVFSIDPKLEEMRIDLPEPSPGQIELTIDYQGQINDKMAGFYRSRTTHAGQSEFMAVTQFQESSARAAFPCLDHPQFKATFAVELTIDETLSAVSNTSIRAIQHLFDGKKRVSFHATPIMSTYLLFFGVGRFEIMGDSEDPRVRVVTPPGLIENAAFGLNFGKKALRFCEQYFGIAYPLDKLDLLAVPDFAFGAMENWGAITFRENLLLDFPQATSHAGRMRICEVIAHEIVHQWFGNLVTPRDWKYLWLNESFATYFGFGVVDHYYPEWLTWEQFILSQTASALARDALIENFAIEIPGQAHVAINTSTAPLIYSKGGSILRQIEGYLGSELFKAGLRAYLTQHAYGNAASHHLWEALEAASNQPITAVMQSWIEQPGHPLLTAKMEDNTLIITQRRFTFKANKREQIWMIPLSVALIKDDQVVETKTCLMGETEIRLDLGRSISAYKLNPGQTGFYRVRYLDPWNLSALASQVAEKNIGPIDRWGIQDDCFALVLAGLAPLSDYLQLLSSFADEDAFLPLISIVGHLYQTYQILNEGWRPKISTLGRSLIERVLDRIGFEPKADEDPMLSMLRDQILWPAALFGSQAVIEFAAGQNLRLRKDQAVHPDLLKSVLQVTAFSGDDSTLDWLKKRAETTVSEHERIHIVSALGCFSDWSITLKALDYALFEVPARNRFIPIASAAHNPHIAHRMWDWYLAHLADLEKLHPLLYERVIAAIVPYPGLGNEKAVEQFFRAYIQRMPLAADTIRMSLEKLEVNADLRRRNPN